MRPKRLLAGNDHAQHRDDYHLEPVRLHLPQRRLQVLRHDHHVGQDLLPALGLPPHQLRDDHHHLCGIPHLPARTRRRLPRPAPALLIWADRA